MIDEFVSKNPTNAISFISLGQIRYLSAIRHCQVVIGNSSSGLIEVPSFKKPTVNIGDRQQGRIESKSVISCKPEKKSILEAINIALSEDFQNQLPNIKNPYGEGNSSIKIIDTILSKPVHNILKKKFYNITL